MTSALASILISLAAALLKTVLQQRQAAHDAHEVGRLTGVVQSLEAANVALKFKAAALRDPVGARRLRVRDEGGTIELSDRDSNDGPGPYLP